MDSRTDNRVLVAEIDPRHARRLRRILRALGCPVLTADSGGQALALLRGHLVSLAVVAVELEFRGELLLDRLAQLPTVQGLVAIGEDRDAVMERRARSAGARVYLPRPVAPAAIAAALGRTAAEVATAG